MFASGAHPQELKACLKQMQSQLMLKGARIRNLPKGQQQAADLISELSAEALELVCNWFATKTTFGEVIPLSDTIAKLKDGDFSDTGGAPIITEWRSLLSHFCKNQSNTEI
jgi:HAMP domain-containing protein